MVSNTVHDDVYTAHLQRLGWSQFFQKQLCCEKKEYLPARVIGVGKNVFQVRKGEEEMYATLAGKLLHEMEVNYPVVGDWVLLRESSIVSVMARKNMLSRKVSGERHRKGLESYGEDQAIAANLDKVFIVCGLDRDFNLRRIERYLSLVYNCGMEPVVILTKADLHESSEEYVSAVDSITFGLPVYPVSAKESDTFLKVKDILFQGQTAALLGSSGAGKSTLINCLCGEEVRVTSEVGTRVGKGRHTTTSRDLIILPWGAMVIDNPGIREIGLTFDDEGVDSAFPDIEILARQCRFADCSHTCEPGCRVQEAVSFGDIALKRLQNYRKLRQEISYHVQRDRKGAARLEKERWKEVSQRRKSLKKGKNKK